MSFSALPAAPDADSVDAVACRVPRHDPPAAFPAPVPPATRGACTTRLALRHAGPREVRIGWECIGTPGAPVVVVQGGISATRHAFASAAHPEAGWWDAQRGGALDPARYRLLSIDWLGADGSLDLVLDPSDQADAIAAVLDALGIARVHAFVGASYGAMVGLQFAARHGARLARLVAISGAHRAHPQATALRVVQRRILRLGRGEAASAEALALARALAVIGYRSAAEFEQRFEAPGRVHDGAARFAVEDYLDAVGPRFVARFTTTAYLRLSESIDLQRLDPAAVQVPTDLVAVDQDQVVPRSDLEALAAGLGAACRLHRVCSRYGHDAFLKEPDAIGAILRRALDAGAVA